MSRFLQDVRFGVRSLAKSPRFTTAAVLTLALGIGVNTAMFSVIRSVLLRHWPFPHADRLALVTQRQADGNVNLFSTQDFLDWKQQGGLLARMGAHVSWQYNLSGTGSQAERVAGGEVSYDWLPALGVEPALGRLFSSQEDIAGAGNFVLLSSALWKDRYGANPGIVGRSIEIDGKPFTVIGVMPVGFNGLDGKELLWTPLQLHLDNGVSASSHIHWLSGFLRLPDGMSLDHAQNELNSIASRLHRNDPTGDLGYGVLLQSLNDAFTSNARPALLLLMGCVGLVLLIACTNVANLMLARSAARQREMAVRSALGASPLRIVWQLLTESLLLAGVGGAVGIGVAYTVLRGILALHPPSVPGIEQTSIDGMVLIYSLVISLSVGIIFGFVPAVEAARIDLNGSLRQRGGMSGPKPGRTRSLLVITETALAGMLLVATGLALKSLWSLRDVKLGFVPNHVLTFRIAAPARLAGTQISDFYNNVAERVRALPGVESAAVARDFPLGGVDPSMPVETEEKHPASVQGEIVTRFRAVGGDYFQTLGIPLLRGRAFDQQDTATSPPVAIVSESLARKYWPGENAIGKRIKSQYPGSSWCTVVGVVSDVRHWGATVAIEPTAYYPYTQIPDNMRALIEANMGIAVRSNMAQNELLHSVQASLGTFDSQVPIYQVRTMNSMLADSDSLRNFDLVLLGGFSLLALILAAIGVYAVMAYSVSQRTREIGIRIALGAHPRDVLRLTLRRGIRLATIGSVAGAGAAILLQRVMASVLYGLSANDPLVLISIPALMVAVSIVASWLPARKAMRVDPVKALRCE